MAERMGGRHLRVPTGPIPGGLRTPSVSPGGARPGPQGALRLGFLPPQPLKQANTPPDDPAGREPMQHQNFRLLILMEGPMVLLM